MVIDHASPFININKKCANLNRNNIISTFSKRIFHCVVPNRTTYVDCNSPVMIYVLTCNRFSLQYVGKTDQEVKKGLTGTKQVLSCQTNIDSLTFYQIIFTKTFVVVLYI